MVDEYSAVSLILRARRNLIIELVCYRPSIETISNLYSPYFPLDVVRDYVMTALEQAVLVNQVHNRDPIGGSNENLFLLVIHYSM